MVRVTRFPVPPSPERRRRLARQSGLSQTALEAKIQVTNQALFEAGVAVPTAQDYIFVVACRERRIRPDDISGDDGRAVLARRIVRALNAQFKCERTISNWSESRSNGLN